MEVKDHSISQEQFPIWRCQDCSFTFTQDAPAPTAIGPYYKGEEYISHSDSKEGIVNKLYHKARDIMLGRKYQLVNRLANGKRLLDIGTGTGYFLDYMQRQNYEVTGVEIDEDARNYGAGKFGVTIHSPEFLNGAAKAGSYDVITLWHVLEHLYTPLEDLQSSHALLADDGVLIIAVPNLTSADAQHYGAHWAAYDVPRHLWHFSPATMEQMTRKAGFKLLETHHMPMDPFYVSIMSSKYKNGGGLIGGAIQGAKSYLNSLTDAREGSSVIYVLRKQ
ncbi:methyltransferase type 12 [Lewinellaceae bacterium SD302]|nr:methyltransferase type 12 [Lewinellaceae bacterium SD302]